ncbi:virulence-associated E family protein [Wenxinia marina]|uniref:Putative P-loop ATPase n=1 Tax=Wenxinia marina DSM 24838 TaxID=1123501 RepID=A0A0D0QDV7_9RHOB|nr:virulence-associated E family protein [Wenxinia marina]KIQ70552.1 putative P-loop ATPase [Wenxinia marina DSM 24838]GGL52205.1 hypothetical protein GCM10011392_03200 [Wenxinia marina]
MGYSDTAKIGIGQEIDPLDRQITLTRFKSVYDREAQQLSGTLRKLAKDIVRKTAPRKEALSLIKFAEFGTARSEKGFLRHDANVTGISGIELDYDKGERTPEEAARRLRNAGVAGIVVTSPSHGLPGKGNRWRPYLPLSRTYPPEDREPLARKAAAILGGGFAGESFALSTAFYAGGLDGRPPEVFLSEGGAYLDEVDDVDAAPPRDDRDQSGSGVAFRFLAERAHRGVREEEAVEAIAADDGPAGEWWGRTDKRQRHRALTRAYQRAEEEREATMADLDVDDDVELDAWIAEHVGRVEEDWGTPLMQGDRPVNNLHNAIHYLGRNRDTILQGLRWNLLSHRAEWARGEIGAAEEGRVRTGLELRGMPTIKAELLKPAIRAVAERRSYHPIRDQLNAARHDGVPRLDTWLTRYLGAEDAIYTRAVGRAFLIAMVARVMEPGCKHDHVPVLIGPQGGGKSSACRVLSGSDYFSDTLPPINGGKEAMDHLRGLWLVELAELAPSRRATNQHLKSFLSTQADRFREAYGRSDERYQRQCVFVGTTNEDTFLRDATGGRRFWPIHCGRINVVGLKSARTQLFAEAVAAYRAGEAWWLDGDAEAAAREEQEAAYAAHPWEEPIAAWLDNPAGDDSCEGPRQRCTVWEVMELALGLPAHMHERSMKRVGDILKRLGWERQRDSVGRAFWERPVTQLRIVK